KVKESEFCHTSNARNPAVCDNLLPPLAALSDVSVSPQSNLPYPPLSVAPRLDPYPGLKALNRRQSEPARLP
ncbi:hypothetical protein A2U01_0018641, partial [Trifolium medium]|nr:hypothetical protein [Trifolium medium]